MRPPIWAPFWKFLCAGPKRFFLGENGPLGSFPFFRAQDLKHRHVILLCLNLALYSH